MGYGGVQFNAGLLLRRLFWNRSEKVAEVPCLFLERTKGQQQALRGSLFAKPLYLKISLKMV